MVITAAPRSSDGGIARTAAVIHTVGVEAADTVQRIVAIIAIGMMFAVVMFSVLIAWFVGDYLPTRRDRVARERRSAELAAASVEELRDRFLGSPYFDVRVESGRIRDDAQVSELLRLVELGDYKGAVALLPDESLWNFLLRVERRLGVSDGPIPLWAEYPDLEDVLRELARRQRN
jgi:hypothetical protein